MLLSWSQLYDHFLRGLRLRVIAKEENNFSGRCAIEDKDIRDRLHLSTGAIAAWRDDFCDWHENSTEQDNYLASHHNVKATSDKSGTHILQHGVKGHPDPNRAIFVAMVPYEGYSGKKTFSTEPASTKLVALSPVVCISPGDFLGIFPGKLRFVNEKPPLSVKGPIPGLWLDYSQVPGALSRMSKAKADQKTNVCLA
ncbi:hypothetical protein DL98DRAFT_600313 [Cadophora sp. DSE1049]|nr:hypothetical protein DL98DRAFT_600313 [Cadophora sp. DSE1049]